MVDDDGSCVPLLHRELHIESPDLIIHYQGHHGWQKLKDQRKLQLWFPEVLCLYHLPGTEPQGQHPQQQEQHGLVPGQPLLRHTVVDQLHGRGGQEVDCKWITEGH